MKVELVNKGRYTQVYVDGQEIHRVVSVEFTEAVDKPATLLLEILPDEFECRSENCDVQIVDLEDKQKKADGYKDFVKFLFRGKYGIKEEKDAN